jgi:hypothetical protein
MTVYELRADAEAYRWLTMLLDVDFDVLAGLEGIPVGSAWERYAVEPIDDDLNAGKSLGDFPTLGTTPTFSQHAVDALRDMLLENGELLPLTSDAGQFYAYNVTRVVDALDEHRSELKRFRDGGIMRVIRHEFRSEIVADLAIFKVPQLTRGPVFATDAFATRVREAHLKGFVFEEVWTAEEAER